MFNYLPAGKRACLRHRPEQTPLYRVVAAHAQTCFAQCEEVGTPLPRFVTEEFDAYLECGILAHGFSLHAGVRCDAHDRQGLEQLCRYITRPAISNERLSINSQGQVILNLKPRGRMVLPTAGHAQAPCGSGFPPEHDVARGVCGVHTH